MSNAIALPPAVDGEEWRPIPGYEKTYSVSSLGRVFSHPRRYCNGGLLKIKIGKRGYPACALVQDSVQKTYEIHRLMAMTFLGPRPPESEIRHLDGDPLNSHLSNLAYGTRSENSQDTLRHGRNHNANKTHCPQGHPYEGENLYTHSSRAGRMCRTCVIARARARYAAVKAARGQA